MGHSIKKVENYSIEYLTLAITVQKTKIINMVVIHNYNFFISCALISAKKSCWWPSHSSWGISEW